MKYRSSSGSITIKLKTVPNANSSLGFYQKRCINTSSMYVHVHKSCMYISVLFFSLLQSLFKGCLLGTLTTASD